MQEASCFDLQKSILYLASEHNSLDTSFCTTVCILWTLISTFCEAFISGQI